MDETTIRALALQSTAGLRRGVRARATGGPLEVPMGDAVLGRLLDLTGAVGDKGKPLPADVPPHAWPNWGSAPSDGTVAVLVAEPGEAIVSGQPVMTLQRSGERWASVNLREDLLGDLRIGSAVELTPADGTPPIDARVDEIIPRGEFATWRAARAVGDHDLNTFMLHADPIEPASDALQAGMSVWLEPSESTAR